jgi:hypothetical protein
MGEQKTSLDERPRPVSGESSDWLLQAVGELRALEREKRLQEASSDDLHELERRVEEKARAVFRLAQQDSYASSSVRRGKTGGSET